MTKKSTKKSRPVYLDDPTYATATAKAKVSGRSFSNYTEQLIKKDNPERTK